MTVTKEFQSGGYNVIIENMLGDVEVELGVDFFANREELEDFSL